MPDLLKFTRTTLTGGGATAVDGISATALVGNELCWATVSDVKYLYRLNPTSGASADGVNIIIPVVGTVGDKRWILQGDKVTTITLTSGQVVFPATQVPSANANTLDDYEEGTFEVTLTCGTSGTITLTAGTEGKYTKIGNMVATTINCSVASVSSPVGRLSLQGFPFVTAVPVCGFVWANNLNSGFGDVLMFDLETDQTMYIDRYLDGTATLDCSAAIKAASLLRMNFVVFV